MTTGKYFKVSVCYDKPIRKGEEPQNNKPENYLVNALSFTEAEARIIEEMTPHSIGGIEVKSVSKTAVTEILGDRSKGLWYKAKVRYFYFDNEKSKTIHVTYLVNDDSFQEAYDLLNRFLTRDATPDEYDIVSITESNILNVF